MGTLDAPEDECEDCAKPAAVEVTAVALHGDWAGEVLDSKRLCYDHADALGFVLGDRKKVTGKSG